MAIAPVDEPVRQRRQPQDDPGQGVHDLQQHLGQSRHVRREIQDGVTKIAENLPDLLQVRHHLAEQALRLRTQGATQVHGDPRRELIEHVHDLQAGRGEIPDCSLQSFITDPRSSYTPGFAASWAFCRTVFSPKTLPIVVLNAPPMDSAAVHRATTWLYMFVAPWEATSSPAPRAMMAGMVTARVSAPHGHDPVHGVPGDAEPGGRATSPGHGAGDAAQGIRGGRGGRGGVLRLAVRQHPSGTSEQEGRPRGLAFARVTRDRAASSMARDSDEHVGRTLSRAGHPRPSLAAAAASLVHRRSLAASAPAALIPS